VLDAHVPTYARIISPPATKTPENTTTASWQPSTPDAWPQQQQVVPGAGVSGLGSAVVGQSHTPAAASDQDAASGASVVPLAAKAAAAAPGPTSSSREEQAKCAALKAVLAGVLQEDEGRLDHCPLNVQSVVAAIRRHVQRSASSAKDTAARDAAKLSATAAASREAAERAEKALAEANKQVRMPLLRLQ